MAIFVKIVAWRGSRELLGTVLQAWSSTFEPDPRQESPRLRIWVDFEGHLGASWGQDGRSCDQHRDLGVILGAILSDFSVVKPDLCRSGWSRKTNDSRAFLKDFQDLEHCLEALGSHLGWNFKQFEVSFTILPLRCELLGDILANSWKYNRQDDTTWGPKREVPRGVDANRHAFGAYPSTK